MDFFKRLGDLLIPSLTNEYRPYLLRRAALMFFLALVLSAQAFVVIQSVTTEVPQAALVVQSELIQLTNKARTNEVSSPLNENLLLTHAAQQKAQDMAARGYFSHTGPGGELPWEWLAEAGYEYRYAGENLAVRFTESEEVVEAWMQSPSHRANIVKPQYTEIGIGVAEGTYENMPAIYVVQFFATPKESNEAVVSDIPSAPPEPSREPTVAAAAAGPQEVAQSPTLTESLEKFMGRVLSEPQFMSTTILGSIVSVLVVGLLCAFFFHIQIQHGRMLMAGSSVMFLALALLLANEHYFKTMDSSQAASTIHATAEPTISEHGYWISIE